MCVDSQRALFIDICVPVVVRRCWFPGWDGVLTALSALLGMQKRTDFLLVWIEDFQVKSLTIMSTMRWLVCVFFLVHR